MKSCLTTDKKSVLQPKTSQKENLKAPELESATVSQYEHCFFFSSAFITIWSIVPGKAASIASLNLLCRLTRSLVPDTSSTAFGFWRNSKTFSKFRLAIEMKMSYESNGTLTLHYSISAVLTCLIAKVPH